VAAVGRELDGVVQQIRQRLSQQLPLPRTCAPEATELSNMMPRSSLTGAYSSTRSQPKFRQIDRFPRHRAGLGEWQCAAAASKVLRIRSTSVVTRSRTRRSTEPTPSCIIAASRWTAGD